MSDDFIPLNQSTPSTPTGGGRWQNQRRGNRRGQHSQHRFHHNQNQSGHSGSRHNSFNRWNNSPYRNSSYGSDSHNSSYGQDKTSIDAYLHSSMLQDPWAELKRRMEETNS